MPPYLHPHSTATSTLFASTLVACFIVVGIPHVFPCPAPRRSYADSRNIARATEEGEGEDASTRIEQSGAQTRPRGPRLVGKTISDEAALFRQLQQEAAVLDKQAHECPVPKPTGWLAQVLGLSSDSRTKITITRPDER